MTILTRYVLSELLQVFLLTLAGLTAFIFIAMAGKEAVDKGLGIGPLLRMTPYLLPQAMQFAVPGTMLLATTSVFGRMAANNEVVALKSMGITPWKLAWPTFVLATLVSFGAVFLNDLAVSWGRSGVERVFVESIEEVVYGQLRVHHSFTHEKLNITVHHVEGRRLIHPMVTGFFGDSDAPYSGTARWAELESRPETDQLVIRLHELEVDKTNSLGFVGSGTEELEFDLSQLFGGDRAQSPSNTALRQIAAARGRQQQRLAEQRDEMAAQAALALMTGELEQLTAAAWKPYDQATAGVNRTLNRLGTEPYRRWSTGFSCLGFVLLGVPVAIILRKGEFLASFFMCFAPILILYYPLLIVSLDQTKQGTLPPPALWIGNLVLALAGLGFMRRVVRY